MKYMFAMCREKWFPSGHFFASRYVDLTSSMWSWPQPSVKEGGRSCVCLLQVLLFPNLFSSLPTHTLALNSFPFCPFKKLLPPLEKLKIMVMLSSDLPLLVSQTQGCRQKGNSSSPHLLRAACLQIGAHPKSLWWRSLTGVPSFSRTSLHIIACQHAWKTACRL